MNFKPILEKKNHYRHCPLPGGFWRHPLDISTFYLPMAHLRPASLNVALDMRTRVVLYPWTENRIKVTSRGFEPAEFDRGAAPFDHPLGFIFALAQFFNAHGVHIHIDSASPPKSALGGSSCAGVAVTAAFFHALGRSLDPTAIAWQCHYIESGCSRCGLRGSRTRQLRPLAVSISGNGKWMVSDLHFTGYPLRPIQMRFRI